MARGGVDSGLGGEIATLHSIAALCRLLGNRFRGSLRRRLVCDYSVGTRCC